MRRILKAVLPIMVALTAFVANMPEASAYPTPAQTQPWHGGRVMYDNSGDGSGCTSALTLYNQQGRFYKATPIHCLTQSGFHCKYENIPGWTDWCDWNNIIGPPAPWAGYGYDIALIELGLNSAAKSRHIYDYCNPSQLWNCTSEHGGGTANNPPWSGHWRQNVGYFPTIGENVSQISVSGYIGGTSTGNTIANTCAPGGVHCYHRVGNLGNCGGTYGMSGGVVFAKSAFDYGYVAGMAFGGNIPYTAMPGNSCYAPGTPYGDTINFYSIDQINTIFSSVTGSLTPFS